MRNKLISITFVFILLLVSIGSLILPDKAIAYSERRHLKEMPTFTFRSFMKGDFFQELETYYLDQMISRDNFRNLKSLFSYHVLHQSDVNGIFLESEHLFKWLPALNESPGQEMANYMNTLKLNFSKNNAIYWSLIPDKTFYLKEDSLQLNYQALISDLNHYLDDMTYIDLMAILTLDDYYKTDPHWRQEKLEKVIIALSETMGFDLSIPFDTYEMNTYNTFYGAYFMQSAFKIPSEKLVYLEHRIFDHVIVKNYESGKNVLVYDLDKLNGMDAYDVFLSGASPLIEILNTKANTSKELVIFRDSYTSSLAPLLLTGYAKITLVDTRYMASDLVDQYIHFDSQDILFLYSGMIMGQSNILK